MRKGQKNSVIKKQYSLKPAQQQAFLQVFNLHAVDGKITPQDLHEIFVRINFKISASNFQDIVDRAFVGKKKISFEEFMETFKVREANYDLIDIKNAFKLIAGDSDDKISVELMKELFEKQGLEKDKIEELFELLGSYTEKDGNQKMFNFKLFLSHLS